jgi:hypothetical protein
MSEETKKSATKPIKVIRHGAVAASIWHRQSPSGFKYYEYSLSRAWKTSKTGREGYSANFFAANEPELQAAVREASSWIAGQPASLQATPHAETEVQMTLTPKGAMNGSHVSGRAAS